MTSTAGADIVVSEALLDSGGSAPERTIKQLRFAITTPDGTQVEIEPDVEVAVVPTRTVSGPWREIRDHAARPRSAVSLHHDGYVELTYGLVAAGDHVCVIGVAKDHAFVPDTGGPRDAPARALRTVEAHVIGVGQLARAAAEAKLAAIRHEAARAQERERNEATRAAKAPERQRHRAIALRIAAQSGRMLLVATSLVVIELFAWMTTLDSMIGQLAGLWGLWFVVAGCWIAVPACELPGGASSRTVGSGAGIIAAGVALMLLVSVGLPISTAWQPHMDEAFIVMNLLILSAMSCGLVIAIPIAHLAKPRARPALQIELPTHRLTRAALWVGGLAVFVVAIRMLLRLL